MSELKSNAVVGGQIVGNIDNNDEYLINDDEAETYNHPGKKDFMLIRVMGQIYLLNKSEIPEQGILRTLYEGLVHQESVVNIDQKFTTKLLDFVFSIEKTKNIYTEGCITCKAYLFPSEYTEIVEICRFFQFSERTEKEIMNHVELHWIYRFQFYSTTVDHYSDLPFVNIFAHFLDNKPFLSVTYGNQNLLLTSFTRCNVNVEGISKCDAILLENNLIIFQDKEDQYHLYQKNDNNEYTMNRNRLSKKSREFTYDPIKNEFIFK
jgi:hypothetical protein